MSIDISILRAMVAAGAPVEAILAAVEADQLAEGERVQARRTKDAERQRRRRDVSRDVTHGHAESQPVTRTPCDVDGSLSSLLPSLVSTTKKAESKKERARKTQLPDDWQPKPRHYEKAKKYGHPEGYVEQKADALRSWAAAKAILRASWDATFDGFLEPKEARNGFGGPRPLQDDSKSVSRAAERLAEKAQRGEFTFGPRPTGLPEPDAGNVRLLSKG